MGFKMENIIIFIIIAVAAIYVGRKFYKTYKAVESGGCGCTCKSCGTDREKCSEGDFKVVR